MTVNIKDEELESALEIAAERNHMNMTQIALLGIRELLMKEGYLLERPLPRIVCGPFKTLAPGQKARVI